MPKTTPLNIKGLRAQEPSIVERELLIERLKLTSDCVANLPVVNPRTAEEIIGYDEHGVPK